MTGEKFVAQAKETLQAMLDSEADGARRGALAFVLMNWFKFEPARVGDMDEARISRRLSDTVFNYLGTRDADEVAQWIAGAREELAQRRAVAP